MAYVIRRIISCLQGTCNLQKCFDIISLYYFIVDLFQLWMDSIHCYSRLEEDNNTSDDKMTKSDDLNPQVVIVGTWKDAVASDVQEVLKIY